MPREYPTNLASIFSSGRYSRREILDIYLADGSMLYLSRGGVMREAKGDNIIYQDYIRTVDDMVSTLEQAVDRVSIGCQNINSELGFKVASDLRLLDYALCDYGKVYQSNFNPSLISEFNTFRGVMANASADEKSIKFELVVDYESLWQIIASRNLGAKSPWVWGNGIESTVNPLTYPEASNTRQAYRRVNKEWEFGGWEFFEEPTSSLPGTTPGDTGIGNGEVGCFSLETLIWTPKGEIPIGDFPLGKPEKTIKIYSFDEMTGEIFEDEIDEVLEYEAKEYYDFEFERAKLRVTGEHPIYTDFGKFTKVRDLHLQGQTVKMFDKAWLDLDLKKTNWNTDETGWDVDKTIKVRNLHVKHKKTYFANKIGVHNKPPGTQPVVTQY